MTDTYSPGQELSLTVIAAPRRTRDRKTVENLMRLDPDNYRSLKKAHDYRVRTLVVRSRGKRPWAVRRKAARVVRAEMGATWSMKYFPHIAPELRAVSKFLEIKPA